MRFYFDSKIGSRDKASDSEGAELDSIEAAEEEAVLAAAEMAAEALASREADHVCVDVRDETGRPLLRAKVVLVVEKQQTC
jgi:hypothetical protein